MSEFDFWRECLTIPIDNNIRNNKYYFYACEYMAKTELYDRWLTDKRSPYDKTSAFITPNIRGLSRLNCKRVLEEIYQEILKEWDIDLARVNASTSVWIESELHSEWQKIWNEIITHNKYSAQKWIDEYNWLLEHKGENI